MIMAPEARELSQELNSHCNGGISGDRRFGVSLPSGTKVMVHASLVFATSPSGHGLIDPASLPGRALTQQARLTHTDFSMNYDPSSDQYIYVWKTNSAWAGTCRQLLVRFNDDTTHVANFKFR